MAPLHQMLIIVLAGVIGFLIVIGIVSRVRSASQATNVSLPAEVIEHSKKYVQRLGSKPFEGLKTNQKLILIHSYYNLDHHDKVVRHAEMMIDELRTLSPERKIAFVDIIENSYHHLSLGNVAIEFRRAVGL